MHSSQFLSKSIINYRSSIFLTGYSFFLSSVKTIFCQENCYFNLKENKVQLQKCTRALQRELVFLHFLNIVVYQIYNFKDPLRVFQNLKNVALVSNTPSL